MVESDYDEFTLMWHQHYNYASLLVRRPAEEVEEDGQGQVEGQVEDLD